MPRRGEQPPMLDGKHRGSAVPAPAAGTLDDGPRMTAEQGGPGIQAPDRPERDTPPTPVGARNCAHSP